MRLRLFLIKLLFTLFIYCFPVVACCSGIVVHANLPLEGFHHIACTFCYFFTLAAFRRGITFRATVLASFANYMPSRPRTTTTAATTAHTHFLHSHQHAMPGLLQLRHPT